MRTVDSKAIHDKWVAVMQQLGAYWHHDGNLKRPYALLTGGKISNFYANCAAVTKRPDILSNMAYDLLQKVLALGENCMPDAYVGSAYGAITLAFEIARQDNDLRGGEIEAWFTAKAEGGTMKLDRFEFTPNIKSVIMVEDVITSFKTTRNSIIALKEKIPAGVEILPYVLCIVNRSGLSKIEGFEIISLIEVNNALTWEPGQNPFLGKEPERVEPVRPKQNWAALNAEYPA